MSNKRTKRIIVVSTIVVVIVISAIVIVGNEFTKQKNILGCQNTVKCQVTKSGDYSRKYVYNTYYDGDDKVIFQYGLFQDSYKYEKQELFKGINLVKPFPEAALPNYAETHMEFRHYQSKCEPDIVFDPDDPHDQLALSFGSSMSYKEVMEYNTSLNNLGYAVKFCWVDTYLSDDVQDACVIVSGGWAEIVKEKL